MTPIVGLQFSFAPGPSMDLGRPVCGSDKIAAISKPGGQPPASVQKEFIKEYMIGIATIHQCLVQDSHFIFINFFRIFRRFLRTFFWRFCRFQRNSVSVEVIIVYQQSHYIRKVLVSQKKSLCLFKKIIHSW